MTDESSEKPTGISRREFVKNTGGAAALSLGLGASALGSRPAEAQASRTQSATASGGVSAKPYNVLLIFTDQERYFPEVLGKGHWPARDRLARTGTTFTKHNVCSMVCTPTRSVFFTGQHIQHTKMFDNTNFPWVDNLSFDIPTIGHMMRDAGYYSTYQGKWHLHGQIHEHFTEETGMQLVGHDLMDKYGFSDFTGIGDIVGNTMGGYHTDQMVTATAEAWLRRKGKALNQEGQPWFMTLSLVNPHDVMFYNTDAPGQNVQGAQRTAFPINRDPDDAIYRKQWDLPLSPSRNQPWDAPGRPKTHQEYQKCRRFLVGQFPNDDDGRWQRLQNYYLNCISDCDRSMNSILTELDNLGMTDNTIVVFTSDHGELAGAHGMSGKGATAYREQNNVNLIISHPDVPGGKQCNATTSHVDVVPTILAMTGADKKQKPGVMEKLHGHDVSSVLTDPESAPSNAVRDAALYNFSMWCYMDSDWLGKIFQAKAAGEQLTIDTMQRPDTNKRSAIRSAYDGRYKFNRYFNMESHNRPTTMEQIFAVNDIELFDLQNDPYEMNNLAIDRRRNGELIMAMNAKLNSVIDEEVGEDMGQHLPEMRGINWAFDRFDP